MNNNFDDILREKWEEKQFPVDPVHRQQMLDLLEKNNRRKPLIFWWLGGLLMMVVMAGFIFLLNNNQIAKEDLHPTPSTLKEQNYDVAQFDESRVEANKNELASTGVVKDESAPKKVQAMPAENNASSNKSSNQSKSTVTKSSKPSSQKPSKNSNQIQDASSHQSEIFPIAPNSKNSDEIVIRQESPIFVSDAFKVVVLADDDQLEDQSSDIVQRNSYITAPIESLLISEQPVSHKDFISAIKPSESNFHYLRLFAETGLGFIPSVTNEYSSGWTFNAGAGISYRMSSKINLFVSGGYLFQNGGFNFEKTSAVQQPAFGVRSNFNTLRPDKLHFIYSKLGLQYGLKRHLFSVNGGLQYLYGAQGTINVQTVDQFTGTSGTTQYTWLSIDGMRQWLWNGEALYGYRITPRMTIQAGVKYNFSSIETEDSVLAAEGYYWQGQFSSLNPSFIINYQFYGKR